MFKKFSFHVPQINDHWKQKQLWNTNTSCTIVKIISGTNMPCQRYDLTQKHTPLWMLKGKRYIEALEASRKRKDHSFLVVIDIYTIQMSVLSWMLCSCLQLQWTFWHLQQFPPQAEVRASDTEATAAKCWLCLWVLILTMVKKLENFVTYPKMLWLLWPRHSQGLRWGHKELTWIVSFFSSFQMLQLWNIRDGI